MSVTNITWPATIAELSPAEYHRLGQSNKIEHHTILCPYVIKYVHLAMLANLKPLHPFSLPVHHLDS
jgi:hypothetical protein